MFPFNSSCCFQHSEIGDFGDKQFKDDLEELQWAFSQFLIDLLAKS